MNDDKNLYRVRFISQDKVFEIYAKDIYQGELYGFVVVEGLVFDSHNTVLVDPGEEKLKSEFEGVNQTTIPMHSIIRIDSVKKRGVSKVVELDGNVAQFPSPIYTPDRTPES